MRTKNTDYKYINDKPKGILFVISSRPTDWGWCEQNSTDTHRQAGYPRAHPNHSCSDCCTIVVCHDVNHADFHTSDCFCCQQCKMVQITLHCVMLSVNELAVPRMLCLVCIYKVCQFILLLRFIMRQQRTVLCHFPHGRFAHSKFTSFNSHFVCCVQHACKWLHWSGIHT